MQRELRLTRLSLVAFLAAAVLVGRVLVRVVADLLHAGAPRPLVEQAVFILIVLYLTGATVVYFLARLAHYRRLLTHAAVPRRELERVYDDPTAPSVVALVPSYCEEPAVVRQALLSAALVEYPRRRVVLLIDDPPEPTGAAAAAALMAARQVPMEISRRLADPRGRFQAELDAFETRMAAGPCDAASECARVAALYLEAASWLDELADDEPVRTHTDRFFVERVLREPACAHAARAAAIREGTGLSGADLRREYRRLAALFAVEVTSFERKRHAHLSHEPNKAMNLNSYIGLFGSAVPAADYVITLDADSLILHDYALRLIHVMQQPGGRRVAVAQTPYTAIPARPGALEQTAGAQTDQQWLVSQGLTAYGAAFWVGASAVLRYEALADIAEDAVERGHPIRRFVRDRTLTEDSESTIHLMAAGWTVHNYPDRLAYSATPPDFGTLVIQRRRWANGGLLILPLLVRQLFTCLREGRAAEWLLRAHYLSSTALASLAILVLITYPLGDSYVTPHAFGPWLPAMSVPYFAIFARDLAAQGYGWRDLLRIHAMNLLLVPVQLAGTVGSLRQAWTGRRIAFARTPKVSGRTASPARYVLMPVGLAMLAGVRTAFELRQGHWGHAPFTLAAAAGLAYACVALIGWPGLRDDLLARARLPRLAPGPLVLVLAALAGALVPLGSGRGATGGVRVAITVDDLPSNGHLPDGRTRLAIAQDVLDALGRHGVREAYAFANGHDLAREPALRDVVRAWAAAGHPVGNHGFGHADLNLTTVDEYVAEIERMDALLLSVLPGQSQPRRRVYRYPFLNEGNTLAKRGAVRDYLSRHDYRIAPVTVDFYDWAWNAAYGRCRARGDAGALAWLRTRVRTAAVESVRASSAIAARVVGRDVPHVLLMHVGEFDALTLDLVLGDLRADGVTFVPLEDALRDPAYAADPGYTGEIGLTFLEQLAAARGIEIGDLQETPYTIARLNALCAS